LTADITPRADVYLDACRRFPFPSESLDGIFAEEVIEHVSHGDALGVLSECWRVLKPGGALRLSTPDLGFLLGLVQSGVYPECRFFADVLRHYGETQSPEPALAVVRVVNNLFYEHGHRFLYSAAALKAMLENAGFFECRLSSYRDPNSPLGLLDSHADRFAHPPELSIYMDARKPGRTSAGSGTSTRQASMKAVGER